MDNQSGNKSFSIDITGEVCPMTFVKTKLLIEKMKHGDCVDIRLKGREPLKNVPQSASELGHEILSLIPEEGEGPDGTHHLLIRKK
ncbi:sulfurtransferase TusA family protein [Rhodospirillum sp. A1_3_36]|uniref:sulfurtransferase TusA family protein n=1 Tax=Rhodospirillum sp. A1_3_36 TaxID=3391666 RepID=UPI0039A52E1C